ncbi:MAG: M23 family metallopeptidase [Alphaproteobacteria bacterium]|nr:M23 family metallopeptidase [Alphaproteobacteria bacterium]MBU0803358.1 M23 family metallopeptidase [Alphaproteobacteria bacterium]MBU0871894.1 M23 family metallopeptidase [Alphaproteobacteria bacterium]MBU1402287.1 M23 family metallopeptidase [Alphaproteobacteria bacterium]MBU1590932.1 M23 family metallopeptidase [Alphaproteobacteria bacterium]
MALRFLIAWVALAAVAPISAAAEAPARELQLTPLVAEVVAPPRAVPGSDGQRHLVYELAVTNMTGGAMRIDSLDVVDAASGKPVATLGPDALEGRVTPGARRGHETAELSAYQFAVIFLHVAIPDGDALPARLLHEISANFELIGKDMRMLVGETEVIATPPVVLGPPLRGKGYVVGDGCCVSIRHVRALLALGGQLFLAQRFAIDWEKIDADATLVAGDTKDVANYHIYGEQVLAVADGEIVAMRNDLPDQVPGALPAGLPIDEADGNFVVLDIGAGAYAAYAHMRPGSLRVKSGDGVRRGDVLGEVGNSGNSQAPHLHLHVMDGDSALASNGVPYVFDAFAIAAVDEAGTEDFDKAEATGSPLTLAPRSPPSQFTNVLPLDLSVVDWPD